MDYIEYLKMDHWLGFREKAVQNADKKCCLCAARNARLNVHHNNYECLWNEKFSDVAVLCRGCHEKVHDILPEPPEAEVICPVLTPIERLRERMVSTLDPEKRDRLAAQLFVLESDMSPEDMAVCLMEM